MTLALLAAAACDAHPAVTAIAWVLTVCVIVWFSLAALAAIVVALSADREATPLAPYWRHHWHVTAIPEKMPVAELVPELVPETIAAPSVMTAVHGPIGPMCVAFNPFAPSDASMRTSQ